VPVCNLPNDPSLENLKNRAKTLQRLVRADDAGARSVVDEFHPRRPSSDGFSRADAQLVLARQYGFDSWTKLRRHLDVVEQHTRRPDAGPTDLAALACLNYGEDDPARWQRARELLDADPALTRTNIHAAAAAGDAAAVRDLLARDPSLVDADGGGYGWVPLMYATYSRLPGVDTTDAARTLLDAGADPNAGYLWFGLTWPFTALTGAFGGGEGGQPPHANALGLARLLLERGADGNDAQTTYNRGLLGWDVDTPDHLELLGEFGFGGGEGGPWHRLLGHTHPSPRQLAENELRNAAEKNRPRWARLMIDAGVDVTALGTNHPTLEGDTALQLALRNGNDAIVGLLLDAGAPRDADDAVYDVLGACMRGDRDGVDPALVGAAIAHRPHHVATAADRGRVGAVRLMAELGFDVNAPDRSVPHRATALHYAAFNGDEPMVNALLALGADRAATDASYQGTPAGWADHAGHDELSRRLAT